MATSARRTQNGGDGQPPRRPGEPSILYKAVMTPVIFVTFVVSLTLVDYRYSAMRSQYHAEAPSRLPAWVHRLVYRYQPYQYVLVDENRQPTGQRADPRYLHSKQRKLMKMEVVDAFEIRSTVLVILGLLSLALVWGVWQISRRLFDAVLAK